MAARRQEGIMIGCSRYRGRSLDARKLRSSSGSASISTSAFVGTRSVWYQDRLCRAVRSRIIWHLQHLDGPHVCCDNRSATRSCVVICVRVLLRGSNAHLFALVVSRASSKSSRVGVVSSAPLSRFEPCTHSWPLREAVSRAADGVVLLEARAASTPRLNLILETAARTVEFTERLTLAVCAIGLIKRFTVAFVEPVLLRAGMPRLYTAVEELGGFEVALAATMPLDVESLDLEDAGMRALVGRSLLEAIVSETLDFVTRSDLLRGCLSPDGSSLRMRDPATESVADGTVSAAMRRSRGLTGAAERATAIFRDDTALDVGAGVTPLAAAAFGPTTDAKRDALTATQTRSVGWLACALLAHWAEQLWELVPPASRVRSTEYTTHEG
eukprot:scaffold295063_cov31-Tisochrysis_lutea.AAC.4